MILAAIIMMGCNNDDPLAPTLNELAYEKLAGQWSIAQFGSIKVDGADVSANYPGFSLSFTEGGYTTTNGGDLFSASGTWEWLGEEGNQVALDDGKEITLTSLTLSRFVFTFTKSDGPVRAGIAGNYVVTVTR